MIRINPVRALAIAVASASVVALAACATPSNPAMMTVAATPALSVSAGQPGYRSVTAVTVSGGQETNPLWTAQVSDTAFRTALEGSLAAAGYMGSEGPATTIDASLIDLKQPMIGLDFTVTSQVRYSVVRDGQTVFDELVAASGTATLGDAFAGVERLKIANEKSVKANIEEFLTRFHASAR